MISEGILKDATKTVSEGNTGEEQLLKGPGKRSFSLEKNFQILS